MNGIICTDNTDCFAGLTELLCGLGDKMPVGSGIYITDGSEGADRLLAENTAVIIPHEAADDRLHKSRSLPLITLGFDPRSTLSFSGQSGGYMYISLQRSFKSLGGRQLDPCEYRVERRESPYTAMALLAAGLLLSP